MCMDKHRLLGHCELSDKITIIMIMRMITNIIITIIIITVITNITIILYHHHIAWVDKSDMICACRLSCTAPRNRLYVWK